MREWRDKDTLRRVICIGHFLQVQMTQDIAIGKHGPVRQQIYRLVDNVLSGEIITKSFGRRRLVSAKTSKYMAISKE